MARTKNEIKIEKENETILETEYTEVMQKSYLDYSMSVIVSRAVPDVRDGLKPVQRRILYDMSELGTASDKPYRKSARIVGDTMGKYHPHGDSSIYGSLVVMAQDFKYGMPLTDGHGNFGSIEGDGAAAMRYTEARLQKFTEKALLKDLKENTVDFVPNFDETEKEPAILPCKVPNLLINGSEGIAVGMATNIPPHNVTEVIDTALYSIDHPGATEEELLAILKGPDFPTGGIVSNASELPSIYKNGYGKIKIRGKIELEKQKGGKYNLVITEIPYTMIGQGISKFLMDTASLVEDRTLPEISDITNQSSKDGIRIVLELKKGAEENVENIKNILYKKTKLEDTFGFNMLAIHDGRPEIMNLSSLMNAFWDFQFETYTRRTEHLLGKDQKKKEIDEGLLRAVDVIDLIIEILRGSKNTQMAKDCLVFGKTDEIRFKTKKSENEAKKLCFTEAQATAILDMRLSRLIGLELEAILKDLKETEKRITHYEKLLSSKSAMTGEIKKELTKIRDEFHKERRTNIIDAAPVVLQEVEEPEIPLAILMDRFGYVHAIDESIYQKNKEAADADYKQILHSTNKGKLILFTDTGKMHTVKNTDIPYGKLRDKGQPLDNICGYNSKEETIVAVFTLDGKEERSLIFTASDGLIKRVSMAEFDVTRRTIDATKLTDGERLMSVLEYSEKAQIILSSNQGYFLRFTQAEIPVKKKNAVGAKGISLAAEDRINTVIGIAKAGEEFLFGEKTYTTDRIKLGKRGAKGIKCKL